MKILRSLIAIPSLLAPIFGFAQTTEIIPGLEPHRSNPILPGYYADPSVVQNGAKAYIYATLDSWGDETLGCWESSDWKHWTYRVLDWPTKAACKSPTSASAGVWAPSVVKGLDGKFHMYVSVRNEVWAGVADSPLGPWKNALGDKPLINGKFKPGFHMIDAEAFIDDDGQAYLYWGSGYNWVNGKCWAVKLKPDMVTFDGEVRDVTPANYFEGPFMLKHGGKYYLTYSQGKTTEDSYRVHYAIGDTPLGPFAEAANSPILVTDKTANVISPGHHTVFFKDGVPYILYHRQSIPFDPKFIGRQPCVQPLRFTADGLIEKITPYHEAPDFMDRRADWESSLTRRATATASSSKDRFTGAERALDDNYATRWAAAADAKGAWLQLDFPEITTISRQIIQPEYAWKPYRFTLESSEDGRTWKTLVDFTRGKPASGSPIVIEEKVLARYLRLVFPDDVKGSEIALFEWMVR